MNQITELLDLEADMTRHMRDALTANDHIYGMYFHFMALLMQEQVMRTFLCMPEPDRQAYVNLVNMLTMGETLYEQYV
jgi:hypothetical protein